ncbi:MAG: RtcB family protein, partial [Verrucomicrobiota bacterium]
MNPRLARIDANRIRFHNPFGIEATLFANEQVPIESAAVTELLELLELQETVERFAEVSPDSFDQAPLIKQVAVTPDFHKARGIPVGTVIATRGFVVPQAIGNDVNCGMRLHLTSLKSDQITANIEALETELRHLFFEGGRNIPMTRVQREALFRNGLTGLLDATPKSLTEGLWSLVHELKTEKDLPRIDRRGSLKAEQTYGLDDFMGPADRISRDSQIGSIGGGNHFVEVQRVEKLLDVATARAWGIKPGMVTVMVHTGSVSIGHLSGTYYRDAVRGLYPATLKHPENGIFVLPQGERYRQEAN